MHPAKIRFIGLLMMAGCIGVGVLMFTSVQDKERAGKEVHGESYEIPLSEGLTMRGVLMVCMAGTVVGVRLIFHSSEDGPRPKHEVQFEKPEEGRRPI